MSCSLHKHLHKKGTFPIVIVHIDTIYVLGSKWKIGAFNRWVCKLLGILELKHTLKLNCWFFQIFSFMANSWYIVGLRHLVWKWLKIEQGKCPLWYDACQEREEINGESHNLVIVEVVDVIYNYQCAVIDWNLGMWWTPTANMYFQFVYGFLLLLTFVYLDIVQNLEVMRQEEGECEPQERSQTKLLLTSGSSKYVKVTKWFILVWHSNTWT